MLSKNLTFSLSILIALFLMPIVAFSAHEEVDFMAEWVRNADNTDLQPAAQRWKIELNYGLGQDGNALYTATELASKSEMISDKVGMTKSPLDTSMLGVDVDHTRGEVRYTHNPGADKVVIVIYPRIVVDSPGSTKPLETTITKFPGVLVPTGGIPLVIPDAGSPGWMIEDVLHLSDIPDTPQPPAADENTKLIEPSGTAILKGIGISAGGFIVVGHTEEMDDDGMPIDYSGVTKDAFGKSRVNGVLPNVDLEEFFLNGGEILLRGPANAAEKDVVISEIMWGSDAAAMDANMTHKGQWIELYNTTDDNIASLDGWALEFLPPNGRSTGLGVKVDEVTNLGPTGYWQVVGQSGRSAPMTVDRLTYSAVDIISMYRNIDYAKVEKDFSPDTTNNAAERKTQLSGIPDGRKAGSWKASVRPSLNLTGHRIGTPGAPHYTRISSTPTAPTRTVLINEIGNGTDDSDDWLELMNTTDSAINIKNWELSIVTGLDKDTALVTFPDNDNTVIPAKGILLISNSSPEGSGNDLAAGVQANIADDNQVKRGGTSEYYVDSGLKIPNDGQFLLILRSANDKEGKPEAIVDAGGGLYIESPSDSTTHNTEVWPLQATASGHGDVIDGKGTGFKSALVYKRNGNNSGIGEHHWAQVGWTGIGYDRTAEKSAENGGTPGYPNGALKEKVADLSDNAEVSISEIMFDAGYKRRHLPQWIEIYNSSMTQAVNLNGWKLEIQNYNSEDVDARLNATLSLGAMTVAPNQTVLIVSTSGLNSGVAHFPATRLVNLWTTKAHRDALELTGRNDQVLSGTGFYLQLRDKDNKVVDEVGNLDGNKRTQDEPAWALPMDDGDERRSSIIRVYDAGIAIDGTSADGWVSASATNLAYAISHTYYGNADDLGTPAFRGGGPLPVSLSSFRPARDKATGAVVIRWATESELNNAGFNILRAEAKSGEFKVVNTKGIIPGHGTTSEKHVYSWTDTSAKPNVVYYYQIEDVSLDGQRTTLATTHLRGNVNAAGKAPTTWGELKTQD